MAVAGEGAPRMRELVELIYASALEPDGWGEAIRQTADFLEADAALAYLPGRALQPQDYAHDFIGLNVPTLDEAAKIADATGRLDAYLESGKSRNMVRPGYIGLGQDLCDDRRWDENPWSELAYRPYDIRPYIGFVGRMPFDQTPAMHFSLFRRTAGTPFGTAELKRLSDLQPHLERAARMVFRLRQETQRRFIAEAASDALANPILIVDAVGRLLEANTAAESALRKAQHLSVRNGFINAASARSAEAFCQTLCAAAKGEGGDVWLECDGDTPPLSISATPLNLPFGRRAVLLFLTSTTAPATVGARLIRLYGLSAAEAQVATAIADGVSPTLLAQQRGVKIETIRAQLRSTFAKTDVGGQVGLVRLVERLSRLR